MPLNLEAKTNMLVSEFKLIPVRNIYSIVIMPWVLSSEGSQTSTHIEVLSDASIYSKFLYSVGGRHVLRRVILRLATHFNTYFSNSTP